VSELPGAGSAERLIGRTKENDVSVRGHSEKITGRTKENHEGVKRAAEKQSKWMKDGGSVYVTSFITEEGHKRQAEKITGAKNPSWNGGSSFEPYGVEFNNNLKRLIRERDEYMCHLCGEKGNFVHHIDYNKKNNSAANLITLCNKCHTKTNSRREEFQPFLELYMLDKYEEDILRV
jgi:hypothetical protein